MPATWAGCDDHVSRRQAAMFDVSQLALCFKSRRSDVFVNR